LTVTKQQGPPPGLRGREGVFYFYPFTFAFAISSAESGSCSSPETRRAPSETGTLGYPSPSGRFLGALRASQNEGLLGLGVDRFLRRAKKDLGAPRRSVRLQSTETGVDGSKDDRYNELLRTGQDLSDAGRKAESHEPRHESSPQARNNRPQPRSQLVVIHAASPPRRRVISFTIASA